MKKDSFTAIAIGNVDVDECLDVWMVNEDGEAENVVKDSTSNEAEEGICVNCPGTEEPIEWPLRILTLLAMPFYLGGVILSPALPALFPLRH